MKMPIIKDNNNLIQVLYGFIALGIFLACEAWAPYWITIPVGFATLAALLWIFRRLK